MFCITKIVKGECGDENEFHINEINIHYVKLEEDRLNPRKIPPFWWQIGVHQDGQKWGDAI